MAQTVVEAETQSCGRLLQDDTTLQYTKVRTRITQYEMLKKIIIADILYKIFVFSVIFSDVFYYSNDRHRASNMFLEGYKRNWIYTEGYSFEDRMIDDLSVSDVSFLFHHELFRMNFLN